MNNDTIFDVSERKKKLAKTALNEVLKELKSEGILVGYDNVEGCFYVADAVLAADRTHYDTEASGEYVIRNRIDLDGDLTRFFGTNAAEGFGPVFKGDRDMDESRSRRGRMLKEGSIPNSVKRKFIDADGRNKRYSKRYELVNKAKILGATEIETYEEYREIDHEVWLTEIAYSMDMNGNRNGILWYGEKDGKYYYIKSYDVGGRASY